MNRSFGSVLPGALLVLSGCFAPARVAPPPIAAPPSTTTVIRVEPRIDSPTARLRVSELRVIVRAADDPTEAVMGAEVRASRLGADSARFPQRVASTDTFGNVRLDSLPAGDWHIEGLRIGYKRHSTIVRAVPGCRTVVELYLEYAINCLFGCPTTPPRAVVTACPS